MSRQIRETSRRQFIHFLSASPLFGLAGPQTALPQQSKRTAADESLAKAKNVFEVQKLCSTKLTDIAQRYCDGGADDLKTIQENSAAFDRLQIRARRLVNVSKIDTRVKIFDQQLASPIMLSPVGFLQVFHKDGELATAAACNKKRHQMIVSTVSTFSIKKIAAKSSTPPWFQLYPTPRRKITKQLIRQARAAKCKVMALTVDTPVIGNRENHAGFPDPQNGERRIGRRKFC